ncbi:MAG: hypothetical protein IPK82_30895 [Polyangiaceae bacterium]|nr:hypothetical protein [Polyangiaceae bacterium]
MRQEIPALAAGVELSDRDIRLKAFLVAESTGGKTVFTPPKFTRPLFDESIKAKAVAHFSLDPQVVDFIVNHFRLTVPYWETVPISDAYTSLRTLGVETAEIKKTLGHEVSTATHTQLGQGQPRSSVAAPSAAPSSEPSGSANAAPSDAPSTAASVAPTAAPSSSPSTDRTVELKGYTVVWQVTDRPRLATLLDEGFKSAPTSERVAKGIVKRVNESTFEITGGPSQLAARIVLGENTLTVSTLDEARLAELSKPVSTTFGAAEHPTLVDLARIENPLGVLAFEGMPWRGHRYAIWGDDIGLLGRLSGLGLFAGSSKKAEKLREKRGKLDDQLRLLERELSREKQAAWDAFAKRFGKTVLFAKQEPSGIAFYGGAFPRDPNLTALAQAAIDTWLSVGSRWTKWNEMADLKKRIRDIDDQLEAEMQSSMGALVGDVLKGLGADEPGRMGVLGGALDRNGDWGGAGIGTFGGGAAGPGGAGAAGLGGVGRVGTSGGTKKP